MPAVSERQRRLFGAALAAKRGHSTFRKAQKIAMHMPESKIRHFAKRLKKRHHHGRTRRK